MCIVDKWEIERAESYIAPSGAGSLRHEAGAPTFNLLIAQTVRVTVCMPAVSKEQI
jgi:hypothetical protein